MRSRISSSSSATVSAFRSLVAVPVQQNGAGAALTVVAALLRAGYPETFAQGIQQCRARVDDNLVLLPVHGERNLDVHGHLLSRTRRTLGRTNRSLPRAIMSAAKSHVSAGRDARASSTCEPSCRHRPPEARVRNLPQCREQPPLHAVAEKARGPINGFC